MSKPSKESAVNQGARSVVNYGNVDTIRTGDQVIHHRGIDDNSWRCLTNLFDNTAKAIQSFTEDMIKISTVDKITEKLTSGVKWIPITGSPGEGKTTLGYLILKEMKEKGWNVCVLTKPDDYDTVHIFAEGKTLFMLNDVCGPFAYDPFALSTWKQFIINVQERKSYQDTEAYIFIGRENVFSEVRRHFGKHEENIFGRWFNLSDQDSFLYNERMYILNMHLDKGKVNVRELDRVKVCSLTGPHGFPHCCKMFVELQNRGTDVNIIEFFQNPLEFLDQTSKVLLLETHTNMFFKEMINNNGKFDVDEVENDDTRGEMRAAEKSLLGSYVEHANGVTVFTHPSIYESVAFGIGRDDPLFIIKNCNIPFILQRMRRKDPKRGVRSEDESPNYLRMHVSKDAVLKYLVPKLTRALTKDFRVLQYDICHDETVCKRIFEEFVRTFQGDLHSSAEVTNVIDVHDVFEETLLLAAANVSNLVSVKTLLDMGADVNVRNRTGQTALHLACEADRIDVHLIKLLLAQGISVNMVDRKGRTALHVACEANRLDVSVLEVLLKTNCDVNITDSSGDTALHKACKGNSGDICILKLQIPPNADTPVPDNESRRSIVRVCRAGLDARDLVHLSTQSVDTNVPYSNEITVLYLLCVGNSVDSDIIRYLSDAGIRMGVENRRERESLYLDNTENRAKRPFEVMVTKGADVKIADRKGTTALHLKCQNISMDVCVIEALINHNTDVNIVNKDGKTALHFACEGERTDVRLVKLLVMNGSRVNIADTKGNTPLHLACLKVCINTRVCEILVTHGADVNMIGENRQTPLHSACTTSDVDIGLIDLLIQHNANVNIPDDNGRTPLHTACTTSDVNIGLIDLLIQHKANLNIPDDNGRTPLHTACDRSDVDFRVIDLLLTYGADANVVDPLNGMTALLFLVNSKYEVDFRVVERLLTHGAVVNAVDRNGNSALLHRLYMSTHKDEGVIELLITHGADVNIINDDGLSALILSGINRKDFGVLELLLTHGADVNSTDDNGRTMLHTILNSNNIDVRCVKLLLTKGADVNIADENRMTAFQSMCIIGSLDVRVIDLLVAHGVDVNTIKEDGGTALHSACSGDNKNVRLVTSLINHGADINVINEDGMTPLHLACSRVNEIIVYDLVDNTLQKELDIRNENDFQVIELLVTNGADVNVTDNYGWTALHRQCRSRSAEVRVIDLLRKHGADVNITDEVGMTALHRACEAGSGFDDIRNMSFEFNDGEEDKEDKICVNEYLIRRYMAVNTADKDAKRKVHGDFIRMLVKLGADVNMVDADGNTALHILCKGKMNENSEISSLMESGADLYRHNRKGWIAYCLQSDRLVPNNVWAQCTNLMMAVQNGDVSAAHELLIQGVPIHTTDRFGRTALHYLCLSHHIDTSVLSLLACKQYVNMPDRFGNTALHCLCRRRDRKEIVNMPRLLKILLEAEADMNVRDEFGFSSLYYLQEVMSSKMLDLLMIH